MKQTFIVDYQVLNQNSNSVVTRMKIQGSPMINLRGATSDFAVQAYIQSRHPGKNINIMNLIWK